jgi:hypothetical protein
MTPKAKSKGKIIPTRTSRNQKENLQLIEESNPAKRIGVNLRKLLQK